MTVTEYVADIPDVSVAESPPAEAGTLIFHGTKDGEPRDWYRRFDEGDIAGVAAWLADRRGEVPEAEAEE